MAVWSDYTVTQLLQILADENIECPRSVYRLKPDIIKLCQAKISKLPPVATEKDRTGPVEVQTQVYQDDNEKELYSDMSSSLAASQNARQQYLSHRRSVAASATSIRSPSPALHGQPGIVKAGRFSMPSDDIDLSPTRINKSSPRKSAGSSPRRSRKTTAETTQCAATTPAAHAERKIMSHWPAVDPVGEPIQWKIRDPFVFDMRSPSYKTGSICNTPNHGMTSTSLQSSPNTPQREQRKSSTSKKSRSSKTRHKQPANVITVYNWGRIISVMAIFCAFSVGLYYPGLLQSSRDMGKQLMKLFVSSSPFCDENHLPDGCRNCPENGICSGYTIECRKPQFRLQRSGWDWICVKDHTSYRKAQAQLESVSRILSQEQGSLTCSGRTQGAKLRMSDGKIRAVFTRSAIEVLLLKRNDASQQLTGVPVSKQVEAVVILFDELILKPENQERYKISSSLIPEDLLLGEGVQADVPAIYQNKVSHGHAVEVYYSLTEDKGYGCIIKQTIQAHLLKVMSICSAIIIIITLHKKYKFKRESIYAIKRIICEQTNIQRLSNKKGYAVGPRPHDMRMMMKRRTDDQRTAAVGTSREGIYSEYATLKLSEEAIQAISDGLVKSDPGEFCRSVLAVDMIPFYYSKRVIDNLLSSSNSTNNVCLT